MGGKQVGVGEWWGGGGGNAIPNKPCNSLNFVVGSWGLTELPGTAWGAEGEYRGCFRV